jgi:hypothetical protein
MSKKAATSAATPKKSAKPPVDWVAVLKSGAEGVKKWNKLTAAQRHQVKLSRADFANCDLSGINLKDVVVKSFKAAGAKFAGAKLASAEFPKGQLAGADFTGADMQFFTGMRADLSGAKLVGANLRESFLYRANLAKADMTRANLAHADLTGADLTDAILVETNLQGAGFDQKTKWPAGFVIPGEVLWQGQGTDPRFSGKGKKAVATDIHGLVARLDSVIDEKRMKRTRDMLKKGKNQLFSIVEPTMVRGIVRSQTEEDLVYSCVLMDEGTYSCATPDMAQCMGLWGEPCKHLLVLILGLARAGQLDPATADKWVVAAKTKNPRWNKTVKNHIADSLLRYKGAQAGDIDWRPTETIPEDFYAM